MFPQGGSIKRLSIPHEKETVGYLHLAYGDHVIGVDFDCVNEYVYYTDATLGHIERTKYNGTNTEAVIKGLKFPEG